MKSPMIYFGGKSAVTKEIWARFGDVENFIDPFCGSLAIIFQRPHPPRIETVNDLNAWVTNAWRALKHDPEVTAKHADWPVSELCLHARGDAIFHRDDWYKKRGHESVAAWIEWIRADPDNYDPLIAGWYLWGNASWIGDDWGRRECRSRPHLSDAGRGVNRKLPHLGNTGQGVNRQIPHLSRGQGNDASPFETSSTRALIAYFAQLAERLRRVRVSCGDWRRVLGPSTTFKLGLTGVFLDPPYSVADRDSVYGEHDSRTVAHDVREWALANGDNPLLRIALCGYDGEHDMPGWSKFYWKAHGGYSCERKKGKNENNTREVIWFNRSCLCPQGELALEFEARNNASQTTS